MAPMGATRNEEISSDPGSGHCRERDVRERRRFIEDDRSAGSFSSSSGASPVDVLYLFLGQAGQGVRCRD